MELADQRVNLKTIQNPEWNSGGHEMASQHP